MIYIKTVNNETKQQRLKLCKDCKSYIKITKQCSQCSCFVDFKTSLDGAICPIGLW